MTQKCFNRKISLFLSLLALCLASFQTALAQELAPTSEAEIRSLINKSRDKDLKVSDAARELLSRLDARSIPILLAITKKGRPCEREGAAAIIVIDLDQKNKDVIPILAELATGRSVFSSEEDLLCRRAAAFLLAWSSEGIRILTRFLRDKDLFVRRSAMFAFYEHTEGSNFPGDSTQAWKEAIPFILETSKDQDEILSTTAAEVLDRFIVKGGEELSSATRRAMGQIEKP